MLNSVILKRRSGKYGRRCDLLCTIVATMITMLILLHGCQSSDRSVIFVNDSRRIAVLDANEPAPWAGVLIPEGRHEYLLDCEGYVIESGVLP